MAKSSESKKPIWMKREGNSLVPADRESMDRMDEIKRDHLVMVTVRQPRNPRQHRMAWGLVRVAHDNLDDFDSPEHLMDTIKVNIGYCDRVIYRMKDIGEVEQLMPRSMAYESMDQLEFEEFFDRMLDYICVVLMPGVDPMALRSQIG